MHSDIAAALDRLDVLSLAVAQEIDRLRIEAGMPPDAVDGFLALRGSSEAAIRSLDPPASRG